MKANRAQIERGVAAPAAHPFFLLHGPDQSGSRALARRIAAAMGAEAERIELSGAELRADPARLADEAASISLFGGARYILVEPAGLGQALADDLQALSASGTFHASFTIHTAVGTKAV